MVRYVDCSFVDTMETRFRDTKRRMMTTLEMVNMRVSYQVDVRSRESSEFYSRHHDAQKDRAAMRAEIEVLRRERLAYEQESIQTYKALARSEAYSRALKVRVAVGIVIKNKARLVAQGHIQEEGIDYDEVFAPVAKIEAIRLFMAYASFKDFVVYQMNVKSAFLYGKIEKEVYVCQPPGFEDLDFPDKVYKVEKALWTTSGPKSMRIFRYLKGQPKLNFWYLKDSPFDLKAYSDSDYTGASLDRKSTTGGCQFLGKRLISWQFKKQTIVANSTTKAEYVAAASCC
nr:copia protein [Tanacetum cinerariifolium]